MPNLTDSKQQELVQGLQAHHAWACEMLIEQYSDMVYNISFRILQNEQEAEDAMQETFITVYRNINNFRGDAKLSSWLYRVATNKALSMLRSQRRKQGQNIPFETEQGYELPIVDEKTVVPDAFILRQESAQLLQAGLEAMSPKLRAAVTLYEIEGLSMKETAAALEISESAAKLRVHRGRKFLQTYLSQHLQETPK